MFNTKKSYEDKLFSGNYAPNVAQAMQKHGTGKDCHHHHHNWHHHYCHHHNNHHNCHHQCHHPNHSHSHHHYDMQVIILAIWVIGALTALPMGIAHTYDQVSMSSSLLFNIT